jgi:hypothetical protein
MDILSTTSTLIMTDSHPLSLPSNPTTENRDTPLTANLVGRQEPWCPVNARQLRATGGLPRKGPRRILPVHDPVAHTVGTSAAIRRPAMGFYRT